MKINHTLEHDQHGQYLENAAFEMEQLIGAIVKRRTDSIAEQLKFDLESLEEVI